VSREGFLKMNTTYREEKVSGTGTSIYRYGFSVIAPILRG